MKTETKLFEIRDRATFIPAIGISLNPEAEDEYLWRSASWVFDTLIGLARLQDLNLVTCVYDWGERSRTMFTAHRYIESHWEELKSGDIVDVEFILGETDKPKTSQALEEL